MTYYSEEDRQEQFILDVLPEVVQDKIIDGPMDMFLEALGYDGYYGVYGDDNTRLESLMVAVGTGDTDKVGKIVIDYMTKYYSAICYDEINDDMAAHGYEFDRAASIEQYLADQAEEVDSYYEG